MRRPRSHRACRHGDGFTLIEAIITVAIVAILAAVAYPTFMDSIRKSRRAEAFAALSGVQQAQERYRANQPAYADNALLTVAANASPPGLGQPATTGNGYYGVALSGTDATGYTATATAVAGKSQANDASCQVLAVRVAGGNVSYGSGSSSADWSDPGRCWAK